VCYARVSTKSQEKDLERQVEFLRERYPENRIVKDIGSGLNWKRKGLRALLEQILKGNINEIVVTYKDRLCRFGFELFKFIIEKQGGKIIVLCNDEESPEQELTNDLISIITVFSSRIYGLRKYKNQIKKNIKEKDEEGTEKIEVPKNKITTNNRGKRTIN